MVQTFPAFLFSLIALYCFIGSYAFKGLSFLLYRNNILIYFIMEWLNYLKGIQHINY